MSGKVRKRSFQIVHPNAAGVDIGSSEHWVSVGEDRDVNPIRRFGTFTVDLYAIADWLKKCRVTSVAMEATGVYWIPLFQILEQRGFEVFLVNPRQVKNVPGRKSDQRDCQWIRTLHTYGLLSASFRPDDSTCVLRSILRHRETLIQMTASEIQRMQKSMTQMNLLLHEVISDITGVTGMKIIRAILRGERDPLILAQFRNPHVKSSSEEIAKALHGDWRDEHLFTLRHAVEIFDVLRSKIEECDQKVLSLLAGFAIKPVSLQDLPPSTSSHKKPQRNDPRGDFRSPLFQITGIDLTQLPGFQASVVLTLVSEVGLDLSRFPSEKHFASWLGLAPSPRVSGGKRLGEDKRHVRNRAAQAFKIAASTLYKSQTAYGAFLRRMIARLGPSKAIKATAHKLACLYFRLLRHGNSYLETGVQAYEQRFHQRQLRNLQHRASELGFSLVPATGPPDPVS
jgi:transposase